MVCEWFGYYSSRCLGPLTRLHRAAHRVRAVNFRLFSTSWRKTWPATALPPRMAEPWGPLFGYREKNASSRPLRARFPADSVVRNTAGAAIITGGPWRDRGGIRRDKANARLASCPFAPRRRNAGVAIGRKPGPFHKGRPGSRRPISRFRAGSRPWGRAGRPGSRTRPSDPRAGCAGRPSREPKYGRTRPYHRHRG